jgi:hypothetical protein
MITKKRKIFNTTVDWFSKSIVLILIYLGAFQDFWIAKNFIYFINFLILLTVFVIIFANEDLKNIYQTQKEKVYFPVTHNFYKWICILAFVSMGWFGSAFIWFMYLIAIESFINSKK